MIELDLAAARRLDILVIYCAYTTRSNLLDSLYSFRRYTSHRIYYFNIAARGLPKVIANAQWDLIVFHTLFFTRKFDRDRQLVIFDKVAALSANPSPKILSPQDEFINSDIVCNFARSIGAQTICTVQPPSVWPEIYGELEEVELRSVLTGYIDPARVAKCTKYLATSHQRKIDVGYRTIGKPVPWFGRHGFLKESIAHRFSAVLSLTGMSYSISTEDKDALVGDSWYDFLGNCKYMLGVEGGTSIYDRDGSIKAKVDEFLKNHTMTSFDLVESECFKGIDGKFRGFAISPRHLEACMTGTCQVLTEGEYSGILRPYEHYIPVSKDLSNVEEVVRLIESDHLREAIVANAYRDIVQSGDFSIDRYPKVVIGSIEAASTTQNRNSLQPIKMFLIYWVLYLLDAADHCIAKLRAQYKLWLSAN